MAMWQDGQGQFMNAKATGAGTARPGELIDVPCRDEPSDEPSPPLHKLALQDGLSHPAGRLARIIKKTGNKNVFEPVSIQDEPVDEQDKKERFEADVMPHLDAAYNLARWLTRHDHDAQDVLQEAFLRAFKFFDGFRGDSSRSWLLAIVRNTSYTWLQKNRRKELTTVFDEELHTVEEPEGINHAPQLQADHAVVRQAMMNLPPEFREVMILRELEGLSYKEIAEITRAPIGTIMSRLARARKQLLSSLCQSPKQEQTL